MELIFHFFSVVVPWIVRIVLIAIGIFLLVLLGRAIRRFSIDRLRYERHFSDACVYEGDSVELIETIWNPTVFFIPFADVESYFYSGLAIDGRKTEKGGMGLFVSRFHLLPFEKVTRKIRVDCVKRGHYRLTSVSVFRCGVENHIDAPTEIYVYPRIETMSENIPSAYGLGDALSRRKLIWDPFSVNGIREYQRGDSFRDINFKASARLSVGGSPRFVVNRYEYCSNLKYYIYQNFHLPKNSDILYDEYEELVEVGLTLSASLLVKALDAGGLCAFSANCGTVEGELKVSYQLRGGEVHKNDVLREMSEIRAIDGVSFAGLMAADIARGVFSSEVFVITPYMDESIGEQISILERFGNTVRVIIPEVSKHESV
ncbi:MAG: DUF58 domain-containing protein [Clostridia bacterium]|nr:DUF58 domain-containing protein [Clostridia bacterium]